MRRSGRATFAKELLEGPHKAGDNTLRGDVTSLRLRIVVDHVGKSKRQAAWVAPLLSVHADVVR
jgi:hypothetical protein